MEITLDGLIWDWVFSIMELEKLQLTNTEEGMEIKKRTDLCRSQRQSLRGSC